MHTHAPLDGVASPAGTHGATPAVAIGSDGIPLGVDTPSVSPLDASLLGAGIPATTEAPPALWAQRVIRTFAAATNLLVCGQSFIIAAPAHLRDIPQLASLERTLCAFGAHPSVSTLPFPALPHPTAVSASASPATQASVLLPPAQTVIVVAETPEEARSLALGPQAHVIVYAPLSGPIRVSTGACTTLSSPYAAHTTTVGPAEAPACDPTYGRERIAWARAHMPVTRAAITRLAHSGQLVGRRIGLALVLEPKTAVLALELAAAGAQVSVFGHADETREDVAAELRAQGLKVFADSTATSQQEEALAREFLAENLEFLLDDGSHLIRMAHDPQRAPGALDSLIGAAEETTSGLRPLRAMEADGALRIPVIASNDARSKTLFDNAYGTGQSCLLTILDLVDPSFQGYPLPGQHVVVAGYGDVGKGCARLAAALGARVSVAEVDPVRALQARMDGYSSGTLVELAAHADLCVSATGVGDTISLEVLAALPDGAVVSVAGGVDQEVATDNALEAGAQWLPAPGMRAVERLRMPSGRELLVTDRGGCINCTAGEGNPIEIMDLSFAVQCAALEMLIGEAERRSAGQDALLAAGLHALPASSDDAVAAAALEHWLPVPLPSASPSSFLSSLSPETTP